MKFKKVLLIDDSEIDNFINKSVITSANITESIETMMSAKKALAYLSELKEKPVLFPDLIFLDIKMPEMDGFQFLDECKNFPQEIKERCSVYILSSSINPEDTNRAKQYDAVKKHLTKPLSEKMIAEILK